MGMHLPPKPRCIYYSSWNPRHLNLEVLKKKEKAWKVKGQLQITAHKRLISYFPLPSLLEFGSSHLILLNISRLNFFCDLGPTGRKESIKDK